MARFINHETEATRLILARRYKILSDILQRTIATELGNAFDKARMVARCNGRHHDPVGPMVLMELPLILGSGHAGGKCYAVDMFPSVGIIIAQCLSRTSPFTRGEEMGEANATLAGGSSPSGALGRSNVFHASSNCAVSDSDRELPVVRSPRPARDKQTSRLAVRSGARFRTSCGQREPRSRYNPLTHLLHRPLRYGGVHREALSSS